MTLTSSHASPGTPTPTVMPAEEGRTLLKALSERPAMAARAGTSMPFAAWLIRCCEIQDGGRKKHTPNMGPRFPPMLSTRVL